MSESKYLYYQDPDTKNCYALHQDNDVQTPDELVRVAGPARDSVNARCTMYDVDYEFLAEILESVDRETVRRDHPRLLAYLSDIP